LQRRPPPWPQHTALSSPRQSIPPKGRTQVYIIHGSSIFDERGHSSNGVEWIMTSLLAKPSRCATCAHRAIGGLLTSHRHHDAQREVTQYLVTRAEPITGYSRGAAGPDMRCFQGRTPILRRWRNPASHRVWESCENRSEDYRKDGAAFWNELLYLPPSMTRPENSQLHRHPD